METRLCRTNRKLCKNNASPCVRSTCCVVLSIIGDAGEEGVVCICHSACPTGWKLWRDNCYHFHDITFSTSGMSWSDARLACQRYGGDLVTIKNAQEQAFLAANQTAAQRLMHYWIGITDEGSEGNWSWIDGTPVAATGSHWRTADGEPNNWGGNENCAEMHNDGLWNDNACFREFAFICKKHKDAKIPTAPTLPPLPSSTKNCKQTILGRTYRGTQNTTKSGRVCQKWSAQSPQVHSYNKPEDNPTEDLVENYCRNPDAEPDGPWCYTTSPEKRWEYCDIGICRRGPVVCEAGWTGFNGSCYRFVKSAETWFEGRQDCQQRGGDLVIIDSAQEQNFITNQARKDRQAYWIGLTDRYTEGNFFWVDGKKLNDSIAYWNTNEPSNAFGGEDCVELYSWYNLGRWNDNKCTTKRYYVCEKISGKSMCPEDWIEYDNMCYQINVHPEQKKTWLDARSACQSFNGADLVTIPNSAVKAKLRQEIHAVFMKVGYFWIGLNDIEKEGTFKWADKSDSLYRYWGMGEVRKNNVNLNCARSELRTVNGFWSLADCNSTSELNYYVCGRKREYDRCHSPLGMENFDIADSAITASSRRSPTTPPSSGRRNAVKAFGLDGAWCAATNDKNQWFRIDLGEFYNVGFIGLQGHPSANSYVTSFYLKFSPDGNRWVTYGYTPPQMYQVLPGNSNSDRLTGATTTLPQSVKARFIELHPLQWVNAICMRVEIYGCPAVITSDSCGRGWMNNTALNSCYKFSMTRLPWAAARANCLLENGDLLSVNTLSEYNLIRKEAMKYRSNTFWMGLNSRDKRGVFRWSDGSAVSSVRWSSGNPSTSYYMRKTNGPKESYTGNWISKTDYYWPLNDVSDGEIIGTRSGNVSGSFQSAFTTRGRQYLKFDGQTSFLKISDLMMTCVSDPSLCSNGLSYSFLINMNSSMALRSGTFFLIDILGNDQTNSVGSYVYYENKYIGVRLRSLHHHWHSMALMTFNTWINFAFTWSEQFGLSLYVNGVKMVTDTSGIRTGSSVKVDRITDLYIGKSASLSTFAQFNMMSLAIWKRSLSADEVKDIYLAELGQCKVGWVAYGQNCYQFNMNTLSWRSAKLSCERRGAQLATIDTSLQDAFISKMTLRGGIVYGAYIGLYSKTYSPVFFDWMDGSPLLYTNWMYRTPGVGYRRQGRAVTVQAAGWRDVVTYYSKAYICQRKKDAFVDGDKNQTSDYTRKLSQYYSATIGCSVGSRMNFTYAVWGKAPSCVYKDVLEVLRRRCARSRYSCRVYASPTYYGRHCSTRMELIFNYTCIPDAVNDNDGCDANWSSPGGSSIHCYKLYQLKRSWSDARQYCQNKGADLVSINSRREEIYLTSMLIDSFELMNIWTGMTDLKFRGSYFWSDTSVVSYTNWYNGQPDDSTRRGSCVKASLNRGYRDALSWTDDSCATRNSFICKKVKASNASCLAGWYRFRSNCYLLSSVNASWADARTSCMRQKAELTSIHSLDENEAIFNATITALFDSAWIGLQDKGIFTGQRWSDRTPVEFVRWDSGQPDSHMGQQSCTLMSSNGFWRDANCLLSRKYICKAAQGKATVYPTTRGYTKPVTPTANSKYCPQGWVWSSVTRDCYLFTNSTYKATCYYPKHLWIGLSDLDVESGWKWTDNSPANFFIWDSVQPDDWFGMEDCVVIKNNGRWADVYCGDKKAFVCRRPNNTMPAISTVAPTAAPDRGFCEPGWLHYMSKCYLFRPKDKLSWYAARNVCRTYTTSGKSGDLVSIHSRHENAFLFSQLKGSTALFIGFNDLQQERRFRWSDQSVVTYTNWYSRQPDNSRYQEDCTEFWPQSSHRGKWNDIRCSERRGYICEKDASATKPTGTTTATPEITCPKGYMKLYKNCFAFKKQAKTWDEALRDCKADDSRSNLASIHSYYDSAFVYSHSVQFSYRVWIGLHRPSNQTSFRWSNNEPLDFKRWYSSSRRSYNQRSCAYFYNGYFVSNNCTAKFPYVCKISNEDEEIKPEHPGTCPTGWLKYDKYCYYVRNSYYGSKRWAAARQICLDFGAKLASIHSEQEMNVIYEKLSLGTKNAWIGLNDRAIEKHMVWSDGTAYDYTNWASKEPNDNQGYENCAEMGYLNGKWNDVSCSSYRGYVCKKELGCGEALGMQNRSIITDLQISASSYSGRSFPQNARLNSRSGAWCASDNDTTPYLQIDLKERKRVNRLAMRGYYSRYVLSFNLEYSDDGTIWQDYIVNGRKAILAGNKNTYGTDGVTLDPVINARFIRLRPLTWKYACCMRIELYGCGYECYTPFGMEARTIRNNEITTSSSLSTHQGYDARLRNPRGQAWCAKMSDDKQWLQIHLSNKPVRISQVATQGTTLNGKAQMVQAYKIAYSDDGSSWTDYKTYQGGIRIFSGNSFPDSVVFHAFTKPVTGRYIRFMPLKWSGSICMRVEVYGCPYECDKPIGIANSKVPDKAITASSSTTSHSSSQARLNRGAFNVGSWCAQFANQQQYLEINLGAESRITAIDTQGFEGDISKYVTDYRVQYSMDAKFWNLYEVKGVIQTFVGNSNGRLVKKNLLPVPIRAKFIRINPRHWKQGICMRIELYGCLLSPATYPTDKPATKKRVMKGSIKLSEEKFIDDYKNKNSKNYIVLVEKIETAITNLYIEDYTFKKGFESVQVTNLKPGSVIASFIIIYQTTDKNATAPLQKAVKEGKLGDFKVDKSSLKISDVKDNSSSGKSTSIVKREGLSTGGKVALVLVFLALIVGIVVAGVIYYYKRRGGAQFGHKSFDNPVHYNNDIYSTGDGANISNLPSQD
eukprot:gene3261-3742_t